MKEGRGQWEGEEEEASTVVSAQFDFYVIKKNDVIIHTASWVLIPLAKPRKHEKGPSSYE